MSLLSIGPDVQGAFVRDTLTARRGTVSPDVVVDVIRLADILLVIATAYLAYVVRFWLAGDDAALPPFAPPPQFLWLATAEALLVAQVFNYLGIYRKSRLILKNFDLRALVAGIAFSFILILVVMFATKTSAWFSRGWILTWLAFFFGALLLLREILFARWSHGGVPAERIAVLGAGTLGQSLIQHLHEVRDPTIELAGWFDDRKTTGHVREFLGHHVRGGFADLLDFVRAYEIDKVVLALPSDGKRVKDFVRQLAMLPVDVLLLSDATPFRFRSTAIDFVGGLPTIAVAQKPIARWGGVAKLLEDKLIAGAALIVCAPLFLAVALAIKLDSPGPIFFRQRRYGFSNRLFHVYKFRTMYVDRCDMDAQRLVSRNDQRVTRIGRFLRRTSLDELPQLFNVLKGDMSIVGPRPHAISAGVGTRPYPELVAEYFSRHRVRPGITGWAQVNGWRGETDSEEKIHNRVACDLDYIQHWSLTLDFWIILRTFFIVFKGQNAY